MVCLENPGGFVRPWNAGPHPRMSDSVVLWWSLRTCIANKSPDDAVAAGPRTISSVRITGMNGNTLPLLCLDFSPGVISHESAWGKIHFQAHSNGSWQASVLCHIDLSTDLWHLSPQTLVISGHGSSLPLQQVLINRTCFYSNLCMEFRVLSKQ